MNDAIPNRDYESYWNQMGSSFQFFPNTRYRISLILEELEKFEFRSILDVGCGDGSLLSHIQSRFPLVACNGCDVSESGISLCAKKFPSMNFFKLDLGNSTQEVKQATFDVVVCSEVIEHLDNYKIALRNLFQLAGPDGLLILTTPTGYIWKTYKYHGHVRHFELKELLEDLKVVGFNNVHGYRYGWPFMVLQNQLADWFFPFVKKSLIEVKNYSWWKRILSEFMFQLFKLNSRSSGPALLVRASRKE